MDGIEQGMADVEKALDTFKAALAKRRLVEMQDKPDKGDRASTAILLAYRATALVRAACSLSINCDAHVKEVDSE